jgi:hypothetical protein
MKPPIDFEKAQKQSSRIVDLYINKFLSLKSIAEEIGTNRHYISRILKDSGVDVKGSNSSLKQIALRTKGEEIKNLYLKGESFRSLSEKTGLTYLSLKGILEDLAVPLRKRDPYRCLKDFMEQNSKDIIRLYCEEKYTLEKLEYIYNIRSSKIRSFLEEKGVKIRKRLDPTIFIKENKGIFTELYESGTTFTEMQRYFDCSYCTIHKIRDLLNLDPSIPRNRNIYSLNDNIFKTIDSEEKAYWLGFLLGDGCCLDTNGYKIISLALQGGDHSHLVKFRNFLDNDTPIGIRKTGNSSACSITVRSSNLFNDLCSYGVKPRKANIACFLNMDNNPYLKHAYRGLIDADGSLGLYTIKGRLSPSIALGSTSYAMIDQYQRYISNNVDVGFGRLKISERQPKKKNHRSLFSLRTYHIKACKLICYLYKDSTIFLDRKMKIAQKVIDKGNYYLTNHSLVLNWDKVAYIRSLKGKRSIYSLAKELKVSYSTVYNVMHNKTWKEEVQQKAE